MTFPARLTELLEKATKGEWSVPHLCRDDIDCDCASILVEGYMGGIGEIWTDNGKQITDGGNDCPPLSEAKANGQLIAYLVNHAEAIRDLVVAMESIAKNTCCDKCQEAALVAKSALAKLEES